MKILVAEDDPVTRRLLQVSLERWQYEVNAATDGAQAWEMLRRDNAPRLVILDWMMPGMDGVEICKRLREDASRPYTYTLLLTSKVQKEEILEGLEAGADDYLIKPFDLLELRARLRAGRRILDLQEQLVAARESLREQATHDGLTGLWARAAILELLQREFDRSRREKNPLSIMMVDADDFKVVNDRFGHQAGDAVLREAARRIQVVLRPYDAVGRYGGEEFVVIAPGCEHPSALTLAERLRVAVCASPIATPHGPVSITLSLGVATLSRGDTDPGSLIRSADAALYRAKKEGRNRTEGARS